MAPGGGRRTCAEERYPSPAALWSAASIRANVSSLPRAATDSKIPGDTVVPVIATRTGVLRNPDLRSRASGAGAVKCTVG